VPGQARGGGGRGGGNGAGGRTRGPAVPPTPEQLAAQQAAREEARKARLSMSMDKVKTIKKMYDDGGVDIELIKFPTMGAPDWTDAEIDYVFNVARTLGARGITCEPPQAAVSASKRLARFADKHRIVVAYHGHVAVADPEAFSRPGAWEQAFFYSKYNWANIDIGHYTVANKVAPIGFLQEYHDRILNVHVKDRQIETGATVPFGEGDSQLKTIIQMMKREQWRFQATIEIEYPVAEGQYMAEHAKCVNFIRDAAA
jgi:sugar phosphate isomerase/epimerase